MVSRSWAGETVACIATGPTLTAEDVALVQGKMPVIAINDAVRWAPWADVLYSSDRYWWAHHKGVPAFSGQRYSIGSSVGNAKPYARFPSIAVLKNTGHHGLDTDPSGLRNGKNSGYAAINLAVHFGASRILLLGYTMGIRSGKPHFFGSHPPNLANPTDSLCVTWRRLFKTLVAPLKAAGVDVVNCTPNSSLDCFPMADLRSVLGLSVAEVA